MKKFTLPALTALLLIPEMSFAQYYEPRYGMMSGWGFGFSGMYMAIFWLIVILGMVFFFRRGGCGMSHHDKSSHSKNAQDILKERYAKGEIDKNQFEEMKRDLN